MAADHCPCPKKSTNIRLLTVDGEEWWECAHQGCDLRVSGARHYWRASEHQMLMDEMAKKGGKASADNEDEEEDEEAEAS